MESSALVKLGEVVGQIRDPRVTNRSDHLLVDIVGVTILAVGSGADDFVAVASFAGERRDWLGTVLGVAVGHTIARSVWSRGRMARAEAIFGGLGELDSGFANGAPGASRGDRWEDAARVGEQGEGSAGVALGLFIK